MKKIYSIKETIFFAFVAIVFCVAGMILLINFNDVIGLMILGYCFVVLTIALLFKLFAFLNHITICDNKVTVFDFPFFATNKFFEHKRSLILWNSEINIDEVEYAEIVKLTNVEKNKYIGYHHLFNKFIKVGIRNSQSAKYVYISNYSTGQIRKIMDFLESHNHQ